MPKLTPEMKRIFLESIDAAEGPGACVYTYDGVKPVCVAAQIVARVEPTLLPKLKNTRTTFGMLYLDNVMFGPVLSELARNIWTLQNEWDYSANRPIDEARDALRSLVEQWSRDDADTAGGVA